ncbi:CLUMA_CG004985, isoform A [Clunio marinus]|uniref:CLUMA_CG004985, isoform A n=1 Tax=Clunio marinus TaxID=568069 RepID=A0A1J1HTC7_9DIPT|nr:CLUMA_CG004985, isoform A [Clunio marinus]
MGECEEDQELRERLKIGPQANVDYPINVLYCGNCKMPIEYCEFWPGYEKCKQWLEKFYPEEFSKLTLRENAAMEAERSAESSREKSESPDKKDKRRQRRGGKGQKKEDSFKEKRISVMIAPRSRRKVETVISGLEDFGIDLKVAVKVFGTKYACGSSITDENEISIQGNVKADVIEFIAHKWPELKDVIDDNGDYRNTFNI